MCITRLQVIMWAGSSGLFLFSSSISAWKYMYDLHFPRPYYARLIEGFDDKLSLNRISEETNYSTWFLYRVFCCHRPHPPPQSSVGRLTVPSAPTPRSIHFLSIQPTRVVMMSCCIEVAFLKGSNSNLLIPRLLAAPTPLIRSVWLYWQMLASPQYKLL